MCVCVYSQYVFEYVRNHSSAPQMRQYRNRNENTLTVVFVSATVNCTLKMAAFLCYLWSANRIVSVRFRVSTYNFIFCFIKNTLRIYSRNVHPNIFQCALIVSPVYIYINTCISILLVCLLVCLFETLYTRFSKYLLALYTIY